MASVTGTDDTSDIAVVHHTGTPEVNELLCFVQQKANCLPVDDIVKLCSDFYTSVEVETARSRLQELVQQKRLSKPKVTDAEIRTKTLTMIVKVCLDPSLNVLTFCAMNLSRIPPVDIAHVDASAILHELSALRREVRCVTQLKEEVTRLHAEVNDLRQLMSVRPMVLNNESDFPALSMNSTNNAGGPADGMASFVSLAKALPGDNMAFKKSTKRRPPVFEASSTNNRIKSVATTRQVDIFVSRLDPNTHEQCLCDCVNEMKGNVKVADVKCTKLQSKFESLYSSFHVSVSVDSADMKRAIELFMAAESWPMGVFVKRYFKPKNDG